MAAPNRYDEFIRTVSALQVTTARLDERLEALMASYERHMTKIEAKFDQHLVNYTDHQKECCDRFTPLENFQKNVQGTIIKLAVPILILLVGQLLNGLFKWY